MEWKDAGISMYKKLDFPWDWNQDLESQGKFICFFLEVLVPSLCFCLSIYLIFLSIVSLSLFLEENISFSRLHILLLLALPITRNLFVPIVNSQERKFHLAQPSSQ